MPVRLTIVEEIKQIAVEQKKTLAPLSDELALQEIGFDSLCFAILIARLEDALGCDPFTEGDNNIIPNTFGEFVRAYDNATRQ